MKAHIFFAILFTSNTFFADNYVGTAFRSPIGHVAINQPISDKIVLTAFATAIAAYIINNISWHSTYAQKASQYYQTLMTHIHTKNITDVHDQALSTLFTASDFDVMIQHQFWLQASYNNWITFWNWTPSQKQAIEQFYVTLILTQYSSLLQNKNLVIDDLKKDLRLKFGIISIYPLLTAYETTLKQCEFISQCTGKFSENIQSLLSQIVPCLKELQTLLRQDADFIKEQSDKRTHDLQKELINATLAARR